MLFVLFALLFIVVVAAIVIIVKLVQGNDVLRNALVAARSERNAAAAELENALVRAYDAEANVGIMGELLSEKSTELEYSIGFSESLKDEVLSLEFKLRETEELLAQEEENKISACKIADELRARLEK